MSGDIVPSKNGVIVLSGYGISLAVTRGHLVVSDGIGSERRSGRFSRIVAKALQRIVVIGYSGFISFEAVHWLCDVGIAFVQLDYDGNVLLWAAPTGTSAIKLQRAQAIAPFTDTGLSVVRYLISAKLDNQARVISPFQRQIANEIRTLKYGIGDAQTIDTLRVIEAQAAILYWNVIAPRAFPFIQKDEKRVPEHWKTIGPRVSPLSASPRNAVTPFHAMLNYLYAILESETTIALKSAGLDPSLGILHLDTEFRQSFACDVMEAVRPDVDKWLLDTIAVKTFAWGDFAETREGQCRLLPTLARQLAETAPAWKAAIVPIVERIAALMLGTELPEQVMRRAASVKMPLTCKRCGAALPKTRRAFCSDDCKLSALNDQRRAKLRGLENRQSIGEGAVLPRKPRAQLLPDESADYAAYLRDIAPDLRTVSLYDLQRVTGLSRGYCKLIRLGKVVPHSVHWEALRRLIERFE
jgi:CRISPR-associated endonuclease Cas1